MNQQEQFIALYSKVHDAFERFCRARAYGSMEYKDLMNESLLIAFQKFEQLRHPEAFFSFLCGISIRIMRNHLQKKKASYLDEKTLEQYQYTVQNGEQLDVELLYKALELLPEEQREALILFEISGFSIREISELQHASEAAVKQRLKRGRDKLAELLKEPVIAFKSVEL